MEKHLLEEFRRAAGLTGTRFPEYRLDEKKAAPDLKVFLGDLHHDFDDLVKAITSGMVGDPLVSAVARLRSDLTSVEQAVKRAAQVAPKTAPPKIAGADPGFADSFAHSLDVKGKWTRSIDEWLATMRLALQTLLHREAETQPLDIDPEDDTYNEFKASRVAKWLKKWEGSIEVLPARESSVALYVRGIGHGAPADEVLMDMEKKAKSTKADEIAIDPNGWDTDTQGLVLRLWWD